MSDHRNRARKLITELLSRRSRQWKIFALLFSSTFLGYSVGFLAVPLLIYIYEPTFFGEWALFSGISAIVTTILTWRFEYALPIAKNDRHRAQLLAFSMLVALLITVFLLAIGLLFSAHSFAYSRLYLPVILSPIGGLSYGYYQLWTNAAISKSAYRSVALAKILQILLVTTSQLTLGFLARYIHNESSLPLIWGSLIGWLGASYFLARSITDISTRRCEKISMTTIRKYRTFALYSMPAALFMRLSTQLPNVLLSFLYGLEIAGAYAIAHRLLGMPAALISQSLAQTFLGLISERSVPIARLYINLRKILLYLTIPFMVYAYLVSRFLQFYPNWAYASMVVLLLSPYFFLQLSAQPLSVLYVSSGFQYREMFIEAIRFSLGVIAILSPKFLFENLSNDTLMAPFTATNALVYILWHTDASVVLNKRRDFKGVE